MSRCVICGETDPELIVPHHTIPRSLVPLWKATIPLCYRCHKKVHRYIIKDLRDMIDNLRTVFLEMQLVFDSHGLFAGEDEPVASKILEVVMRHRHEAEVSVKTIADECSLEPQKVGNILRDMGIIRTRRRKGMAVRFAPRNTERVIQLSIKNGLFPKEKKARYGLR